MRSEERITITLPPKILKAVDKARREEARTRSEYVREALRDRLSFHRRSPEETATPAELRAIRRGLKEYAEGRYVTHEELLRELGTGLRRPRKKKTPRYSR